MTITKTKKGFVIKSKTTGKTLSKPYKTRDEALHRERQIQYFKNNEKYKKDHHGRSIPVKKKSKK